MRLGKRLQKILDCLEDGAPTLIDVGTDHGILAFHAIKQQKARLVYATDISAPSLKKAQDLSKKEGLEDKMICLVSDGLKAFPSDFESDVVVIAGMGAIEIIKIIQNTENLSRFKKFILQPMQDPEGLRKFVYEFEGEQWPCIELEVKKI